MDEVKEVFFAPSIAWFKSMAKQLRLHIRWDVKQYYASLNLLARIYGFTSWFDYLEYYGGDHAYETFWDSDLDERSFEERRYMQATALMQALQIGESEATKVLDDLLVSSQHGGTSTSTKRDQIQKSVFALQERLDEHREAPHAPDAGPAKPVVTFKRRHKMVPDVVHPRGH